MVATAGDLGTITRQPYERLMGLDGFKYLIDCDTIASIDRFLMSECSRNMTDTDVAYAMDFIEFQKSRIGRMDIIALNDTLLNMVVSGKNCITLQGEISGC